MKKIILLVLAACYSTIMLAQSTVTGTVVSSDDGQPLPFATIQVKGTTTGEYTDDNGKYSIKVPANGVLIFSTIGFVTQEIPVAGRSVINVTLKPDAIALDETIVVAYGTAKKGTFTGAASVVKNDVIKDVPSVSFENALNGKVAGMQITQSSGQAGSAPSIRIRGIGSMNASKDPLYVVDGIPVISGDVSQAGLYASNNVMSTLNPSDIESITVLKDAAASSLYGSRAANGVIMITTKKGKIGKATVSFKASVGITPSWATKNFEVAGPEQQVEMLYDIFWNQDVTDGSDEASANKYAIGRLNSRFNKHGYKFETSDNTSKTLKILGMTDSKVDINREGQYYDWDKELFRTAIYQNYDLSVSGGSDKTTYYSSFAYTKEQGRVVINDYNRISGRVNLNQKVGKYVEFTTSVNIAHTKKEGFNDTRNTSSNYFMQSRNLLWPLYWPTDYKTGLPYTNRYGSYAQNPVYYNNEWENSSKVLKIGASEALTIKILPELTLKSIFSYDNTNTKDNVYYSANHFNGSATEGDVTDYTTTIQKIVTSTTVNYNKEFAQKHTLGVLVGFEAESNTTEYQRANGTYLPKTVHTVSTAGKLDASGYSWGNAMASVLSKIDYNYDNRYYLSGSYRADGSSKLGEANRWGNFWSVAGSWKINNEKFLKNVDWISNLRLRASYGVNGTLPSPNYGWRSLTSYTSKYMQHAGSAVSTIADPDLTWETSYTSNVALEFGFWDQRLYGTVEFFNRDSKNLLQDLPISSVIGIGSTLMNVGEINNKGVEVEIGGDIIRTKAVTWDASITASFIKSKVTKLYGGKDIIWEELIDGNANFIYREGESTLALYGLEWAGVDRESGRNQWYLNNDTKTDMMVNGRPATLDYKEADQVLLADMNPTVYGGINTSVAWKGISLGLNFIYSLGGYMYNAVDRDVNDDGYYWERTMSQDAYDNSWRPTNKDSKYPQRIAYDYEDVNQKSSRHMHQNNYLRLKTISLGYNFPTTLVHKIGLGGARVYFNGTNLLTWSGYNVCDPEVSDMRIRGWETPQGKTYTFGVEFTF
ncbi:MAG: TonB-dependent receptor [Bacteroidales bacterium]